MSSPKRWLSSATECETMKVEDSQEIWCMMSDDDLDDVTECVHNMFHSGDKKTLFVVNKMSPN